ncbi:MAG TPA: aminoacyl-tRNA hydrolase, partial [Dehalococcoidia bacterium]|nr:aminoacyl-tRNA hydrolase [Dehalococcoidia bacterium]
MRLIVGLGNPGTRYRDTRHNVGFRCVDRMAQGWEIGPWDRRAKAVLVAGTRAGEEIVLAKPRTFMNNSGEGV